MLGRFALTRMPRAGGPDPIETVPPTALGAGGHNGTPQKSDDAPAHAAFKRKILDAKVRLHRRLIDEINLPALEKAPEAELRQLVRNLLSEYVLNERLAINADEFDTLLNELLHEMTGLGPIEPLLQDPTVTDILINTHQH